MICRTSKIDGFLDARLAGIQCGRKNLKKGIDQNYLEKIPLLFLAIFQKFIN